MIYDKLSRRHLLQGAGGFALALPFMPTLMSTAEAAALPDQKFLIMMSHGHGGFPVENMYPINSTVTLKTQTLYGAMNGAPQHDIRYGNLLDLKKVHAETASARIQPITDFDNGAARVSPFVGSFVPDSILAKMNLISGIDVMSGSGHWAGNFGNFANTFGGPPDTQFGKSVTQIPTIDYVIQQSSKFYDDGDRPLVRAPSMAICSDRRAGGEGDLSTYLSGGYVGQNPYAGWSVEDIYSRLFMGVMSGGSSMGDPDAPLVDRLYQDYKRLARGSFGPGRRIGKDDRVRLEQYMSNLTDISSRLKSVTSAACTVPTVATADKNRFIREGDTPWDWDTAPADDPGRQADLKVTSDLVNLMIAQSFLCGTSRIIIKQVSPVDIPNPAYISDYHHIMYHNHFVAPTQQDYLKQARGSFQRAFVDLAKLLDSQTIAPGKTLLDQTLMYWTAESGIGTHDPIGFPTLTAGGAGGFIKTGQYLDVRNLLVGTRLGFSGDNVAAEREVVRYYRGLPQNRWLATICQAMGLSPADYEQSDATYAQKFPERGGKVPGYGDPCAQGYFYTYPQHLINDMSVPMPVIT